MASSFIAFPGKGRTGSMQISGLWLLGDDGVVRPVIRCELLAGDGSWLKAPFLLDSGADRTVLCADLLASLALPSIPSVDQIAGVGGHAASVVVETQIRMTCAHSTKVLFRGHFIALAEPQALDMSVLGRDLTNLFAVIVDRPDDLVCLLGQRHTYTIAIR